MDIIIIRWIFQTLAAMVMSISFGVLFHVPKKQMLFTGISGGSGWLCYTLLTHYGFSGTSASFFAAFTLSCVSRYFAFHRREPVTSFLTGGIFPIVPGAGIYSTGYQFFMGNNNTAIAMGFDTLKTSVAIALGIGIVLALPQILFSFHKKAHPKAQKEQHP